VYTRGPVLIVLNSLRLSQDSVEVSFLYRPEHQRIREVSSRTVGSNNREDLNVLHPDNEGGLYFEREEKAVGTLNSSENRHYISAEKGAFLLITSATPIQSSPVETTLSGADLRYWHKDHLGSIVASTNASGGVLERMAYDPFVSAVRKMELLIAQVRSMQRVQTVASLGTSILMNWTSST